MLEQLCDRWSLIVIRDLMFGNRRSYDELFAQMAAWGRRHARPSRELSVRAELLEKGGAPLWNAFMDELRHLHLGAPRPARSVFGELQAAYEKSRAHRA